MADLEKIVDPNVVGGAGDGTSEANAYASLALWEAAEAQDLTDAGGDTMTALCKHTGDGIDDTELIIDDGGWVTADGNDITISVPLTHRHDTTRAALGYHMVEGGGFNVGLRVDIEWVTVDGMAATTTHANGQSGFFFIVDNLTLLNCLAYDTGTDQTAHGFQGTAAADVNVLLENCIAYGNRDSGFTVDAVTLNHCTAINNGTYGFQAFSAGTSTAANCYAGGNTTADYGATGAGALNTTTSHAADGTADTTTALAVGSGTYFTNVTATTEDVNVTSADSELNENTTGAVTATDYEGDTRDGTNPYAGADELVAAAGVTIPVMIHHYKQAGGL